MSVAGKAVASVGDPKAFAFIRSSAKPFQLAPFVASGRFDAYDFPAPTEALAIMAASHSGEDRHARTVQALLRAGGLTRDVLACGTHRPFDRETADRLIRDGEPPSPLRHNCSGKHAGMALHAKAAGWPVETYWEPDHPVQQLALDTVATLTDVPRAKIALATDGCGVVTFGVPLRGLALAFARLADPSGVEDPALRAALERIRDAMMAHPELVGGERRSLDTSLMRAAPGALVPRAAPRACRPWPSSPASHEGWRSRWRTGMRPIGRAARAPWQPCASWGCSTRRPSMGAWPSSRHRPSTTRAARRPARCGPRSR